jgi:predicted DNA-binding transcriptional regulator
LSRDQIVGVTIIIGALIVAGIYGWLIFVGLSWWAFFIIATVAVIGVVGVVIWIGWVMATTPPPTPLNDFQDLTSTSEEEITGNTDDDRAAA